MKILSGLTSIFACLVLFLTGCHPCDQHEVAVLHFSDDDLAINPYDPDKHYRFRNMGGDSLVVDQGWRANETNRFYETDYETAKEYYHGCQGNFFEADFNGMILKSGDSVSVIGIDLRFLYTFDHPTSDKTILFGFDFPGKEVMGFTATFGFEQDTLYNYVFPGSTLKDSIVAFHPVITIGPRTYPDVYELFCHQQDGRYPEWYSTAWYSIRQGLVGIRTNLGTTWYLDQ